MAKLEQELDRWILLEMHLHFIEGAEQNMANLLATAMINHQNVLIHQMHRNKYIELCIFGGPLPLLPLNFFPLVCSIPPEVCLHLWRDVQSYLIGILSHISIIKLYIF